MYLEFSLQPVRCNTPSVAWWSGFGVVRTASLSILRATGRQGSQVLVLTWTGLPTPAQPGGGGDRDRDRDEKKRGTCRAQPSMLSATCAVAADDAALGES